MRTSSLSGKNKECVDVCVRSGGRLDLELSTAKGTETGAFLSMRDSLIAVPVTPTMVCIGK